MKTRKNKTPAQHRAMLLDAMQSVFDGSMPPDQGNAVASLSAEVHKSARLEWDVRVVERDRNGYATACRVIPFNRDAPTNQETP